MIKEIKFHFFFSLPVYLNFVHILMANLLLSLKMDNKEIMMCKLYWKMITQLILKIRQLALKFI